MPGRQNGSKSMALSTLLRSSARNASRSGHDATTIVYLGLLSRAKRLQKGRKEHLALTFLKRMDPDRSVIPMASCGAQKKNGSTTQTTNLPPLAAGIIQPTSTTPNHSTLNRYPSPRRRRRRTGGSALRMPTLPRPPRSSLARRRSEESAQSRRLRLTPRPTQTLQVKNFQRILRAASMALRGASTSVLHRTPRTTYSSISSKPTIVHHFVTS